MPNTLTGPQQEKLQHACTLMKESSKIMSDLYIQQQELKEDPQLNLSKSIQWKKLSKMTQEHSSDLKHQSFEECSKIIIETASLLNPDVIIVTFGGATSFSRGEDFTNCPQSYPVYARDLAALEKNVVIINIDPNYKFEDFYIQPNSHVNIFSIPNYDFSAQLLSPIITKWLSESKKVIFHSHIACVKTPLINKLVASLFDDQGIDHNNIEIIAGYWLGMEMNFILTDKTQSDLSSVKETNYAKCIMSLDAKLTIPFFASGANGKPSEEDLHIITSELQNIGWCVCPQDSLLHIADIQMLGSIAPIEA